MRYSLQVPLHVAKIPGNSSWLKHLGIPPAGEPQVSLLAQLSTQVFPKLDQILSPSPQKSQNPTPIIWTRTRHSHNHHSSHSSTDPNRGSCHLLHSNPSAAQLPPSKAPALRCRAPAHCNPYGMLWANQLLQKIGGLPAYMGEMTKRRWLGTKFWMPSAIGCFGHCLAQSCHVGVQHGSIT